MTVLPIVTVGDPVLRERAREVTPEELRSPEVQRLIDDMIETMRAAGGAGLAANQVGSLLRIAVVEVDGNPRYPYKPPIPLTVMVNPVIEPLDERDRARSTRAACRSRTCAARSTATCASACAGSTATAPSTTRTAAG